MIRTETRDSIAIVTIDNPPVNALPVAGWFALAAAIRAADRTEGIRALIVRAEGKGFQAGVDIKELAADDTNAALIGVNRGCYESFAAVYDCEIPVIAAVNGYCLGYGLTLVTWCDFVIASDRAEFGFPEVLIGAPTIVGAIRLPQRVNWQYAMELLLTGERIDAARAKEIGLAGWVVPHDDLMDEARALAARLVRAAPLAARAVKEVAVRSQHLSSLEAIRFGETMRLVAHQKQQEANETGSPSAWSPPDGSR
jgi:enoyl-CoA hydratase/carnithine racemase